MATCYTSTATSTSLVIVKYVPETSMPTKLGKYAIYAKYLACKYKRCMHTYMAQIKSLGPTIQQKALHIFLT